MTTNDCSTCLHEKTSIDDDPCKGCGHSNWVAAYAKMCIDCLYQNNSLTVEPCLSCKQYTKWEKK